jgi:MFS family permease
LTPFATRAVRRLYASTVAFSLAGGMLTTTTAWLVVDDGGGGVGVGLVLAARMLPNLLFGLVAGTLADRFPRTRQLLAVSVAALPIMLLLHQLAAGDGVPLWQLTGLSFAAGCLNVFDIPARQALIVDLVPRPVAANAMAVNAVASRVCFALGALTAGLLIAAIGVASGYLVIAGGYLLSGVLVLAIDEPRLARTPPDEERPSFARALGAAARLVLDVPALRPLLAAGIACEIFGFSFMTAVPVVVHDVLGADATGLGTLNAATSVGGVLAVLALSMVSAQVRREPIMGLLFVLFGVALAAFGATTSLASAALVLVVVGACAAGFDLLQQTLAQLAVPEEQRGRAIGVWVLGIGSAPIGHLEMGLLIAALGAPIALSINGAIVLVAAALLLTRAPRYRWLVAWSGRSRSA